MGKCKNYFTTDLQRFTIQPLILAHIPGTSFLNDWLKSLSFIPLETMNDR